MDLISKQLAIDKLISEPPEMNYGFYYAEKIKALPSAQPEHLVNDTISRQAAIDAFMSATSDGDKAEWCKMVLERV